MELISLLPFFSHSASWANRWIPSKFHEYLDRQNAPIFRFFSFLLSEKTHLRRNAASLSRKLPFSPTTNFPGRKRINGGKNWPVFFSFEAKENLLLPNCRFMGFTPRVINLSVSFSSPKVFTANWVLGGDRSENENCSKTKSYNFLCGVLLPPGFHKWKRRRIRYIILKKSLPHTPHAISPDPSPHSAIWQTDIMRRGGAKNWQSSFRKKSQKMAKKGGERGGVKAS